MRLFLHICFFLPIVVFSQKVELRIKDFDNKQPIGAATIAFNGKPIAKSNTLGIVSVDLNYKIIMVYAMGFDSTEVVLGGANQIVYLYKKDIKIKEVTIKPWVDEFANSLVENMIEKAKDNHPDRLASYQFYTFSKFTADAKEDTSAKKLEFKDSTDLNESKAFIKENKLFVWERLTVFKHDKNFGTKKVLLNSNMSGFKMPIYELLALTMDEVNFLPRMFRSNAYKEYYFRIEDSAIVNARKVYQVAFYPYKRTKNKRSRHGYVKIDAENFACMAYKGTTKQGFFELNNQLVGGKVFSKDMFVHLTNSMIQMGNFNTNTIFKLTVKDLEVPKTFDKSDFKGYDAEISPSLNDKNSQTILSKMRGVDTLDAREKNTYNTMDSIMKKENIETKLRLLLALRNGYIKLNKVNLDILDLIQVNRYEGFRLNLAGETNYSFHPKIGFQGRLGYGFKDQEFKYSLGTSYLLNYQNQSKISLVYENDLMPAGRAWSSLSTKMDRFNQLVNVWFFDKLYQSHNLRASYQSDLHKYLEQKSTIQYEQVSAKFPYQFQGLDFANTNFLNAKLDLKYYPKTKFIVTPEGKHRVDKKPTVLHLNYAFRQPLQSNFKAYHSVNIEGITRLNTPIGKTDWTGLLGYIQGDAPLISLFEGLGSSNRNMNLISTFGLGSYRFFETMEPGSFYSDKYVALFVKHQIPTIKIGLKNELKLSFIYKALLGDLSKPNDHGLTIEAPTELYQETGLEWDNIVRKLPVGLGFYYRIGAYHRGEFSDNFAVRLLIPL
jgi:hypothetical protein